MSLNRRNFLALSAALPWALSARASSTSLPVGLELYSVRGELGKNPEATVRAVAQMGYQVVEFYAPYFDWSESQAKQTRKLLDDLGIRCLSTHNHEEFLSAQNLSKARDWNLILGSKYIVQSSTDPKTSLDQWKPVADRLNSIAEKLEPAGLKVGYHNHQPEFTPIGGKRPIEILAENTKPSVMLQLDVGTCLEVGSDPVAWIRANPGRIRSIHCKDWAPGRARGTQFCLAKGWRIGKASLTRLSRSAEWSTT
jgi:sugar phosphate isomerase/epimerase